MLGALRQSLYFYYAPKALAGDSSRWCLFHCSSRAKFRDLGALVSVVKVFYFLYPAPYQEALQPVGLAGEAVLWQILGLVSVVC